MTTPVVAEVELLHELREFRGYVTSSYPSQSHDEPIPEGDSPLERLESRLAAARAAEVDGEDVSVTLGRYDLGRELGRGGMGIVYSAFDPKLGRGVALKTWNGGMDSRRRGLFQEAASLARMRHPNVVTIYDVDEADGLTFITMELVDGLHLGKLLDLAADERAGLVEASDGPWTWEQVLALFLQAGDGLAHAHEHGIVHGDFKPANVLVGEDERVRVADFGVARLVEPEDQHLNASALQDSSASQSRSSQRGGTWTYMAPERLEGARASAPADQFAFCVSLWEALYGSLPFAEQTPEAMAMSIVDALDERTGIPRGAALRRENPVEYVPVTLQAALLRGLAFPPGQRFGSMKALLDELRRIASTPAPVRVTPPPKPRHAWAAFALGALASLSVVLFVLLPERENTLAVSESSVPAVDPADSLKKAPEPSSHLDRGLVSAAERNHREAIRHWEDALTAYYSAKYRSPHRELDFARKSLALAQLLSHDRRPLKNHDEKEAVSNGLILSKSIFSGMDLEDEVHEIQIVRKALIGL